MAGRYLVIEVDTTEQAGMLMEQINAMTRKGKKLRTVGLFARPGKTCTCSVGVERGYAKHELKRGSRFGWWVCSNCGKPRLGDHDLVNILPANEVIDPHVEEGKSWLSYDPNLKSYVQYPLGLKLVTYPQAVAEAKSA